MTQRIQINFGTDIETLHDLAVLSSLTGLSKSAAIRFAISTMKETLSAQVPPASEELLPSVSASGMAYATN